MPGGGGRRGRCADQAGGGMTWRRWVLVPAVAAAMAFSSSALATEAGPAPPGAGLARVEDHGRGPVAIPLRAPRPGWLAPALEAAVDQADGVPLQAPPDAPLPGTIGIRPGSWMVSPSGCTMAFVFRKAGALGIGTAGHCVENGDDVILLTLALGGEPVLVDIGTVVVDHGDVRDGGLVEGAKSTLGDDFALVAIRPALHEWVFPTIAGVGGPCGAARASVPDAVFHYGHGTAIGTGGTPRAGAALYSERRALWWAGAASPGDSGSPVRATDLSAVSNLTHLVVDTEHPGATTAGTSITRILQIAGGWSLVNGVPCSADAGGGGGSGRDRDEADPEKERGPKRNRPR